MCGNIFISIRKPYSFLLFPYNNVIHIEIIFDDMIYELFKFSSENPLRHLYTWFRVACKVIFLTESIFFVFQFFSFFYFLFFFFVLQMTARLVQGFIWKWKMSFVLWLLLLHPFIVVVLLCKFEADKRKNRKISIKFTKTIF